MNVFISQLKLFLLFFSRILIHFLFVQMELVRSQYEKQYSLLKRRCEEVENANENLTNQYRSASKELLLYKNLVDSPKSKDNQQLKFTIDQILEENQQLYAELNHFKTSDPVYEQVQLLETTNQRLQEQVIQLVNENSQLKKLLNFDETKNVKLRLTKTLEECEHLKIINQTLLQQTSKTPSPKQVRLLLFFFLSLLHLRVYFSGTSINDQ